MPLRSMSSEQTNQPIPEPRDGAQRQVTNPDDAWVVLGRITAPFGLRGAMKLQAETDFPERIGLHDTIYIQDQTYQQAQTYQAHHLLDVRPHGNVFVIQIEGIDTIEAAERLRSCALAIPQSEVAPLADDQYYIHDLVGLRALDTQGMELGRVVDVINSVAQDVLVIRSADNPDVLVPLVKAIVLAVDLTSGTVTLDPPAGMFDDNWDKA